MKLTIQLQICCRFTCPYTFSSCRIQVAPSNEKLLDKIKTLKKNIISNTKEIINKKSNYLNNYFQINLNHYLWENRLKINELKLKELDNKLFRQYEKILLKNDNYINSYISKLDSLNPLNVLKEVFINV